MAPEEIKALIKDRLNVLLMEADASIDALDITQAWQVFKAFAAIHIEQTHGGLLFECSAVNWGKGDFFEVSFLRLFYLEVEEGWDDLTVRIAFSFTPVPELNRFTVSISADVDANSNPAAFIEQVEEQRGVWQAVEKYTVHHSGIFIGSQ